MKVSVLIPTYKRPEFLKRAIGDVLSQTYTDWEIVISDDESGDNESWRYLKDLAAQDKRIVPVKNLGPKHGQVFNVNNGLRQCRGEWIKVLFDDDRMLPECIEKMMAVVERAEQFKMHLAMVGCRAQKWRDGKYICDEEDFTKGTVEVIPSDVRAEINGVRGIYHLKCRRFSLGLKMISKMFLSLRGPSLTLRWLLQETFPRHFSATTRGGLDDLHKGCNLQCNGECD